MNWTVTCWLTFFVNFHLRFSTSGFNFYSFACSHVSTLRTSLIFYFIDCDFNVPRLWVEIRSADIPTLNRKPKKINTVLVIGTLEAADRVHCKQSELPPPADSAVVKQLLLMLFQNTTCSSAKSIINLLTSNHLPSICLPVYGVMKTHFSHDSSQAVGFHRSAFLLCLSVKQPKLQGLTEGSKPATH